MKIPEFIKVGGKYYYVKIVDRLKLGTENYSAETDFCDLEIRLTPQAPAKMRSDFMHEIIHTIFDFNGYKDHDEKQVDELANALYMLVCDNPELFKDV